MRKRLIVGCLLSAAAVGCAGPSLTDARGTAGTHPQAEQIAALQTGTQPETSWTQKVSNVFGGKKEQLIGPSKPTTKEVDPLKLSYSAGPPNAELYLAVAKASDQGGNTAHAREMYHKALTVEPSHLDGMLALARLEDREGQLDAALHYYLQAVKLHPQSVKALNDLSLCFARRGQMQEAVAPLEQAIRLQPGKQLYRNNIAKVLIEVNQVDRAMQHLAAVHAPAVAQYNIGYLLHERGRSQEAIPFLAGATQADPSLTAASSLLTKLTNGGQQQIASQAAPASNNHILPTPTTQVSSPYPSTGVASRVPQYQQPQYPQPRYQNVPAETARVPLGNSPSSLPPVR